MIYFICGMKLCGKSFYGKKVAEVKNIDYYDLEELSDGDLYKSAKSLFNDPSKGASYVVSLPSEVSSDKKLLDLLKATGVIVYLKSSLEVIRSKNLLEPTDEEIKNFNKLYKKQDKIFSEYADVITDVSDYSERPSSRLLKALEEFK